MTRLPLETGRPWVGYLMAVLISALAFYVRLGFDSVLPPGFPYVTFFPAVVAVAVLFGPRPGILAATLGFFLSWYYFVPPDGFTVNAGTVAGMGLYLFVVTIDVVLIHWLQRANARTHEMQENNRNLADVRETLFRELQHRVGNNLQMVGALLSLQKRKLKDKAAVAAIEEAAQRVNLIGRIQRQLYDPNGAMVSLADLLDRVTRENLDAAGRGDIRCTCSVPPEAQAKPELAIPISLIVSEAVSNAIEHGFPDRSGQISVEVQTEGDAAQIAIIDNGLGLPEGFSLASSQNLGLKLSMALANQFGGRFDVRRDRDVTRSEVFLPGAIIRSA